MSDNKGSDRLYRFKVKHRPDLNTMHTDIDMRENSLNNAGKINAKDGVFTNKVSVTGDISSNNGNLITKGNNGWQNETHGGGFYMSDKDWVRSFKDKGIYTSGQIKAGTIQPEAVNVVNEICPETGRISRDKKGATLSCQAGVWKLSGSLQRNTCKWHSLANWGEQAISCPAGEYISGFSRYMENDWTRTGHFRIECCS